jgi:nucleotide-binding universal stress UspA family protein
MKRIVVGVDGSEESRAALLWACDEAELRRAELVALHAWMPPIGPFAAQGITVPEADMRALEEESVRMFDEALAAAPARGKGIERRIVDGLPAPALVAASKDAELLVVGSRGHGGFAGLLLGSVSYACAQRSHCPVAVVRPPLRRAEGRAVVVGVDGSASSRRALAWAAEEARLRGVRLRALHAVELPPSGWPGLDGLAGVAADEGHALLSGAIESELGEAADVELEVPRTSAARALLEAAEDADLLVVGSRGHGGFAGLLLGSVGHQCAQHAPCPVVIVRGAEDD